MVSSAVSAPANEVRLKRLAVCIGAALAIERALKYPLHIGRLRCNINIRYLGKVPVVSLVVIIELTWRSSHDPKLQLLGVTFVGSLDTTLILELVVNAPLTCTDKCFAVEVPFNTILVIQCRKLLPLERVRIIVVEWVVVLLSDVSV